MGSNNLQLLTAKANTLLSLTTPLNSTALPSKANRHIQINNGTSKQVNSNMEHHNFKSRQHQLHPAMILLRKLGYNL
jgi:hypothetical protein